MHAHHVTLFQLVYLYLLAFRIYTASHAAVFCHSVIRILDCMLFGFYCC